MITYAYWAAVIALIIVVVMIVGVKMDNWKATMVVASVVLIIGWAAYYFHFQQVFVKRWGGVMSITVPAGQFHLGATWKDDNLWIENFDPKSNTCYFNEYSKGNLLQGKVRIENCNPLMPKP